MGATTGLSCRLYPNCLVHRGLESTPWLNFFGFRVEEGRLGILLGCSREEKSFYVLLNTVYLVAIKTNFARTLLPLIGEKPMCKLPAVAFVMFTIKIPLFQDN